MRTSPLAIGCTVELHVPDFDQVRSFYSRILFQEHWTRAPEGGKGYLVMGLEGNVICFWGGNENIYDHDYFGGFGRETPRGIGVEVVLLVADVQRYFEHASQVIPIQSPLKERPWGVQDFRIVDPNGYYLRFSAPHDIRDSRYAVP